jgi:hypothetical protein
VRTSASTNPDALGRRADRRYDVAVPDSPLIATVFEKLRGKSIASAVERWRRASWERRLERAAEDARRLAEEAKRRNARGGPRS